VECSGAGCVLWGAVVDLLLGLVRGELCVLLVCWCGDGVMLSRWGSAVVECSGAGCVLWGAVVDLLLGLVRGELCVLLVCWCGDACSLGGAVLELVGW
jgi:hypothetical protein